MNATILDGFIVLVILVFAVFGIRRGLIHRMVSIAAWVGGALAALWGFQPLGEWLFAYISPPWFAYSVAAFGIFVVVFSLALSLRHALSAGMRHTSIGVLDRGLGLLFGMAQGLVLVSIVYLCFLALVAEEDRPDWVAQARLHPVVQNVSILLWKGAIAVSSVEELWPVLRFDPSILPGLAPEQPEDGPEPPEDGPEPPETEEKSGFNDSGRREFERLFLYDRKGKS